MLYVQGLRNSILKLGMQLHQLESNDLEQAMKKVMEIDSMLNGLPKVMKKEKKKKATKTPTPDWPVTSPPPEPQLCPCSCTHA